MSFLKSSRSLLFLFRLTSRLTILVSKPGFAYSYVSTLQHFPFEGLSEKIKFLGRRQSLLSDTLSCMKDDEVAPSSLDTISSPSSDTEHPASPSYLSASSFPPSSLSIVIFWGKMDSLVPYTSNINFFTDAIPKAKLVLFDKGTHACLFEYPNETNYAILDHLRG